MALERHRAGSPDPPRAGAGAGGSLTTWIVSGGPSPRDFPHPGGGDTATASPDGRAVATGGIGDRSLRLRDAATRRLMGEPIRLDGPELEALIIQLKGRLPTSLREIKTQSWSARSPSAPAAR